MAEANLEEVETLEEGKANKASKAKDQVKVKIMPKRKGITNLTLCAIIARSMGIMLESTGSGKETMVSSMPTTLLKERTRKNLKSKCSYASVQ